MSKNLNPLKSNRALIFLFVFISILLVAIFLTSDQIWDWYRANILSCYTLPSGESKCYRSEASFIYDLSGGRVTVVPDNISQMDALSTYGAWSRTMEAATNQYFATNGMTITPSQPTLLPDGSTADPTRIQQDIMTMESQLLETFSPSQLQPSPSIKVTEPAP